MTHQGVTGSSGKSKGKHLEAKQNMEVREQRTETGFSWETWHAEWIIVDLGSFRQTADGVMISSIT